MTLAIAPELSDAASFLRFGNSAESEIVIYRNRFTGQVEVCVSDGVAEKLIFKCDGKDAHRLSVLFQQLLAL